MTMMTIPAYKLVDEVHNLGGTIVLELAKASPPQLSLRLPKHAGWLRDEIKARKNEVVSEMASRFLRGWEPPPDWKAQ